jgi:hypothetical protein
MKILYFAPIAYDGLKQRPQHIAELLSKDNEIWYIEPTISLMKYLLKGGRSYKNECYDINSKFHICKMNGMLTLHISLQAFDCFKLNTISERIQIHELITCCDIIWVGYCGWYDIISKVKDKLIIYDKMDDDVNITLNHLLKKFILRVEPKLINKANVILVTAKKFYQDLSKIKNNVYYIPNALNKELNIHQYPPNKIIKNEKCKVYGYIGMIAHWFDPIVIESIISANENNIVVLVGPNHIQPIVHDRIKYIGTVPKDEIGKYIESFDICLFPFKASDFLDTIDPVKIYEYLAVNKPVIAIDSMETKKFGNLIYRYKNVNELKNLLNDNLVAPFKSREEYNEFFIKNTWENRVNTILEILKLEVQNVRRKN